MLVPDAVASPLEARWGNIQGKDMANRADELLKLRRADAVVDQIVEAFAEASEVHEQALIAMGQQPVAASSVAASTEVVMNLTSDISSRRTGG